MDRRFLSFGGLLCALLLLTSCASYFKRKECEKANWFQHGQDVAMRGENLENDSFLNECRRVEADISERALDEGFKKGRSNYCEPETTFLTGKKGEPFAASMCDGHNLKLLRAKHNEGVREFCQVENGEPAGATGVPYKKVCPKDLESRFLVEFRKGRKKFLNAEIVARETQVYDIDEELGALERDRQTKNYELLSLGSKKSVKIERQRRVNSGGFAHASETETMTVGEDASVSMRRQEIERQISDLDWQIRTKRTQKEKVRSDIHKLRSEMLTL